MDHDRRQQWCERDGHPECHHDHAEDEREARASSHRPKESLGLRSRVEDASDAAFAAVRPVEEYPGREVVAELLEAMRLARGDKDEVARSKGPPHVAVDERARPADDDIHFVAAMWSLWIHSSRRVDLDLERAML